MNPPTCPQCRNPIPPDAPGGICPSCALLGAVVQTLGTPPGLAHAPTLEEVQAAFPELEVLEMAGHGGMGVVFKARQPRLDRLVALKILPRVLAAQPGFSERFTREARALARLNHPNIVGVFDFGDRAGFYYLLMEFVNGVNLRQAIRAGVKPEQALALVPSICEALQFAHDRGVLHRDIKPENILLDTAGVPKLADFGIAKLAGEPGSVPDLTLTGASLGTAAYMAPEQIEKPGAVDHRADIYSLGVVFYEMLTGELPLGRFGAPSEKAKVTARVDEVVMRALEKERERRQQSAKEMQTEVEHATVDAGAKSAVGPRPRPAKAPAVDPQIGDEEWLLRCPSCGRSRRLTDVGGFRIGAVSVGKRVKSKCSQCGFHGMVQVIQAREARTVPFTPDPVAARQQGRGLAIWGAWLNAVPLVLAICFIPLWSAIFEASEQRTVRYAMGWRAFNPWDQFTAGLLGFIIPSGVALIVGFVFTIIAVFGFRYRAIWFFWWLLIYGALLAPAFGVGAIFLLFCLFCHRQFFERMPGVAPMTGGGTPGAGGSAGPPGPIDPPKPWARWKTGLLFVLFSLPVAAVVMMFVLPMWQQRQVEMGWAVIALLALPVLVFVLGLAVATVFRAMVRAGAARGWATLVAVLLTVLGLWGALMAAVFVPFMMMYQGLRVVSTYQATVAAVVVTPEQASHAARLGQGTVELVALSHHPSTDLPWWGMDGMATKEGPFRALGGRSFAGQYERSYEFIFRTKDYPPDASGPTWLIENCQSWGSAGAALASKPDDYLAGYQGVVATLPASLDRANIKVGMASGNWYPISESSPLNSVGVSQPHGGVQWNVSHGAAVELKSGGLMAAFNYNHPTNWQARVVAVRPNGEIVKGRESRMNNQSEWFFDGLKLEDVRQLRFEVREYEWIEFRGVLLSPLERTRTAESPNKATNALYEEGIRLAEERLSVMRGRLRAGVATPLEVAAAERDLAIAEARGNPVRKAEAKLQWETKQLELVRQQKDAGTVPPSVVLEAEAAVNKAQQELHEMQNQPGNQTTPLELPHSLNDPKLSTEPQESKLSAEEIQSLPPAPVELEKLEVRGAVLLLTFAFDQGEKGVLMRARYDLPVDWNEALPPHESYGEFETKGFQPVLPRLASKWTKIKVTDGKARLLFFVEDPSFADEAKRAVEALLLRRVEFSDNLLFSVPDGRGRRKVYLSFKREKPAPVAAPNVSKEAVTNPAREAIYDEAIRSAEKNLEDTKKRVEAGVERPGELVLARRALEVAEARGHPLLEAEARVRQGMDRVEMLRQRLQAGMASTQDLSAAEAELRKAKLDLETAQSDPMTAARPVAPSVRVVSVVQTSEMVLVDLEVEDVKRDVPVEVDLEVPPAAVYLPVPGATEEFLKKGYRFIVPNMKANDSRWTLRAGDRTMRLILPFPNAETAKLAGFALTELQARAKSLPPQRYARMSTLISLPVAGVEPAPEGECKLSMRVGDPWEKAK